MPVVGRRRWAAHALAIAKAKNAAVASARLMIVGHGTSRSGVLNSRNAPNTNAAIPPKVSTPWVGALMSSTKSTNAIAMNPRPAQFAFSMPSA